MLPPQNPLAPAILKALIYCAMCAIAAIAQTQKQDSEPLGLFRDPRANRGGWRDRQRRRRAGRIEEHNEEAMDFLRRLSEVSAGRYFNSEVANLKQAFEQIVEELRHQYRLGFYPPDHPAGSVHTIKVEVRIEATRPDVVVCSRRSYRVAEKPQSEKIMAQ